MNQEQLIFGYNKKKYPKIEQKIANNWISSVVVLLPQIKQLKFIIALWQF